MEHIVLPTINVNIFIAVAIFTVLDLASGLVAAAKEKNIQSQKMRNGLYKLVGYLLVIVLCISIECVCLFLPLPFAPDILTPAAVFIILVETMSILENLTRIVPALAHKKFFELFAVSKEGDDGNA